MNDKTVIATIRKTGGVFNIRINGYNTYNKYGVPKNALWLYIEELTDVFNNVLEVGILFEYEA